jgi:hypothetical protein
MNISPDDPSTSRQSSSIGQHNKCDRIVGRQVRKGSIFYEVRPAAQFGFSAPILEQPSRIAPYNIALFEFNYHNENESVFPIPGTMLDAKPTSIRWFGKLGSQRYFLIEYENQVHRLIGMTDPNNSMNSEVRQFVCKNLENYLRAHKIDNEFPADPEQPSASDYCEPSTSSQPASSREKKVCSCMLSKLIQRAKPKLCLSRLEALIRRKTTNGNPSCGSAKNPMTSKPCRKHSDDEEDANGDKPPKKFGRHS